MQRRHFEAIARELRDARPEIDAAAKVKLQWEMSVRAMAIVCRRFNAQFNTDRFVAACGGLFNA